MVNKENWENKKLEDVCKAQTSNIIMREAQTSDGEYPLFGASGFIKNIENYHQDKPYIGVIKDGSGIGRVNVYPPYSSLLGTMQYIIPKPNVTLDFLKYLLIGMHLERFKSGAAIPHIYFKNYKNGHLLLPPKTVQITISSKLNTINSLITIKQKQLKEFECLEQTLFCKTFLAEGLQWYLVKIGDYFKVGTGATPSRKVPEYYDGDIAWVKSTEVNNDVISNVSERISLKALEETNCKVYPVNTILIAMYGQGKTRGQVGLLEIEAATNQACAAIIPNEKVCNVKYMFFCLKMSYEKLRDMARGANQANLNLSLIKSFRIPLPPLSMQQSFARKIDAIEKQKTVVQDEITQLQALLDSEMDKYFG